jgi:hypothetical protein
MSATVSMVISNAALEKNIGIVKADQVIVEFFCIPKKFPRLTLVSKENIQYPFAHTTSITFDSKYLQQMTEVGYKLKF